MADRFPGFGRDVVVTYPAYAAPVWYPQPYPYAAYGPGAYFGQPPIVYAPEYIPGANWRDNWYDATRTKVHGYTLR